MLETAFAQTETSYFSETLIPPRATSYKIDNGYF